MHWLNYYFLHLSPIIHQPTYKVQYFKHADKELLQNWLDDVSWNLDSCIKTLAPHDKQYWLGLPKGIRTVPWSGEKEVAYSLNLGSDNMTL